MARLSRTGSHSLVRLPCTRTSPPVGINIALMRRSAVVLPEPLRPSSTSVSPGSTVKFRWLRMVRPPMAKLTSRNSTALISCREQRFRERPFHVQPLPFEAPARAFAHTPDLFRSKLMGRFCPDRFTGAKPDLTLERPNGYPLCHPGLQMHFDTGGARIPHRSMLEARKFEFAFKLAIDPPEQVQVESRRHAERIIIGGYQHFGGLHQVCSQQE